MDDLEDWAALVIVVVFCVGLLAGITWLVYKVALADETQWQSYAAENHCREAGYISASTGTGVAPIIGGKGGLAVVSTYTPSKTRYVCDNDVEIYR